MPELYVYIGSHWTDLQGRVGTLFQTPNWQNASFKTGQEVILVDPQEDVRPFNWYEDKVG